MYIYDIAVVGAGAAGAMAAIRASEFKEKVVLIERNKSVGKKILLTGKGRCNITNTASLDTFIKKFGKQGRFLRTAFYTFSNEDLIAFFKNKGLELVNERQGRVFPASHKASSVVEILTSALKKSKIHILNKTRLINLEKEDNKFKLELSDRKAIKAKKVILSTGGLSFKSTGSTGDGFRIAKGLGHSIVPLHPCLVPLRTEETWVKDLQGLALKNVRLKFLFAEKQNKREKKKNIVSSIGEILFTHFGVSGPLILDLSSEISSILKNSNKVSLLVDLKPALDEDKLNNRVVKELKENGNKKVESIMKALLPQRLISVFMHLLELDHEKIANQITKGERYKIVKLLKAFPLTIVGTLSINRGMVTGGGVSTREINPKTLESKLIRGLYFAGEIIDGSAQSGGYNLQQAFSTGYLAGEMAATCVE